MELSTLILTANLELDSTCFNSKQIENTTIFAAQQEQINRAYGNSISDLALSCNVYRTTEYWDFYKKYIAPSMVQAFPVSKEKPPEQPNKKKSTAIVEVAVLIFLLLCLNGVCFWSFIFKLFTH